MIKPFRGNFALTQIFGVNPANYAKFGMKGHNYKVITNLLYLDSNGVIVTPLFGNTFSGILNTLKGLLFIKPIQIIKSASLPLRLNVHQPVVFLIDLPRLNFLLYSSHTFKSIFSLFQKKSKGVFRFLLGLSAPKRFINHSSHLIPFWGLSLNRLSLGLKFRIYQALLLHKSEQYLRGWVRLITFEQKLHNIFRLYTIEGHNTI